MNAQLKWLPFILTFKSFLLSFLLQKRHYFTISFEIKKNLSLIWCRFFYTFRGLLHTHPFNDLQLTLLRRRTLSDVVCDNTRTQYVPLNPFWVGGRTVRCGQHNKMNADDFVGQGRTQQQLQRQQQQPELPLQFQFAG